ncbi:MAG: hypothetical protein P9L92_02760 [Candidatus Electryonea clarkiae]|nr:hypothetical protein [Candidatus Electryonea clarkiae]MDP8285808.1 hypothetical protein [Candidatus Electryonea clarkiae]
MSRQVLTVLFILIIAGTSFIISSCTIPDPLEDFRIVVKGPALGTSFAGRFVNAVDGMPIFSTPVNVKIEGPDKDKVSTLTNVAQTQFRAPSGFLSFALLEDVMPSADNPVEFVVVASADNFVSTSHRFVLTEQGDYSFSLRMVNIERTPPGVAAAVDTNAEASAGVLNQPLVLTTESESEDGSSLGATISLPANTILKDADGNPLEGKLTTSMVQFTTQDEKSVASFPGGFDVSANVDGEMQDLLFFTGGFTAIDITDEEGRSAHTFEDGAMEIQFELDDQLFNPVTGEQVQAGDEIGIWSYNDETGEWTSEGNAVMGAGEESGELRTSFEATHLSYWNLDWHYGNRCSSVLSEFLNDPGFSKTVRVSSTNPSQWYRERTITDEEIIFRNFPMNIPIRLQVSISGVGSVIDTTINVTNCSQEYSFDFADLGIESTVDIVGAVRAYCEDEPDVRFGPSIPVYYKLAEEEEYTYAGVLDGGEITYENLQFGETYQFMGVYEDQPPFISEFTIESLDTIYIEYPLDASFCAGNDPVYNTNLRESTPWGLIERRRNGSSMSFDEPYFAFFNWDGEGNYQIEDQLYPLTWSTFDDQLMMSVPMGLPRVGEFEVYTENNNRYLSYTYDVETSEDDATYSEVYELTTSIDDLEEITNLHWSRYYLLGELFEDDEQIAAPLEYLYYHDEGRGFQPDGWAINEDSTSRFYVYSFQDSLYWDESLWGGERKMIGLSTTPEDTTFAISYENPAGSTIEERYVPLYRERFSHVAMTSISRMVNGVEEESDNWMLFTQVSNNQYFKDGDEINRFSSALYNDDYWLFNVNENPNLRLFNSSWDNDIVALSHNTETDTIVEAFQFVEQDTSLGTTNGGYWRLSERLVDGLPEDLPPDSIRAYLTISRHGYLSSNIWSDDYERYLSGSWKYWFITADNVMWWVMDQDDPVLEADYIRNDTNSFSLTFILDDEEITETYESFEPPEMLRSVPPPGLLTGNYGLFTWTE